MARRRVVILGGGSAGVTAARALEQATDGSFEVTMVTRHPWSPVGELLPAVAAGSVDPRLATAPLRPLLRGTRLVLAEVVGVDAVSHQIQLGGREVQAGLAPASMPYDDVVLALGASPASRGVALPFSGFSGALTLRERLLQSLRAASAEESPRKRKILLTVVILGADTGACALAGELLVALRSAASCWPRIEPVDPRVLLVSPGALLPGAPAPLVSSVQRQLQELGIEVLLGAACSHLAEDHLMLSHQGKEERIEARTVVSTEAPEAPPCLGSLRAPGGLVPVQPSLASATFQGLWAVGACTGAPTLREDRHAQAARCARNLLAQARGASLAERDAPGPFRAIPLAPGVAIGSLGPLPLPAAVVWKFWMFQELKRWWPGASWLGSLVGRPVPGLLASEEGKAPALFETPFPAGALPLPSLPGDGKTAVGLPFTMPLPPPTAPRR